MHICFWLAVKYNPVIPLSAQCLLLLVSTDISLTMQPMPMPWMFVVITLGQKKSAKMTVSFKTTSSSVFPPLGGRQSQTKGRQCKNTRFDLRTKLEVRSLHSFFFTTRDHFWRCNNKGVMQETGVCGCHGPKHLSDIKSQSRDLSHATPRHAMLRHAAQR